MGKQYKNKAKYSFAILLSLILGIGLFSCGNNEEPSSVNSSEQITTSEDITSSEETTSEEVTTEEESLEENSSIDVSSEEPSEDISSDTNSSEEESSIHVHTYTSVVTQPTCEEQGYTTHTCHCGHSYVDTYVDALNHSFTNYVSNKDATCIEDGTETAKCDRCDETHTRVKEDTALGHTVVVDEAVAPTCTETGLTEGSHCSTCNEILVAQEVIAATSHTYGNDYYYDKDYHWNLPTCEHKDILIKQEHTYVDGVCSECGYTEETNDVLTFNLSDDGTYYTVSYCDVNAVNIVIPYYYNDLPVKGIDEYAFLGCLLLEKVNIPNSVISIGDYAFYNCSSLTSIIIPNSVTAINPYAFYNCSSLTSITIPESVTSIGYRAFYGCNSLQSITIPFVGRYKDGSGETHFGYIFGASAYSYNDDYVPTSLKEVIITGGTSMREYAFYNCSSLTSIVIPEEVTSIGSSAFYNCSIITIYCESTSKPSGWSYYWNYSSRPVYWANEWEYVDGVPTPINN